VPSTTARGKVRGLTADTGYCRCRESNQKAKDTSRQFDAIGREVEGVGWFCKVYYSDRENPEGGKSNEGLRKNYLEKKRYQVTNQSDRQTLPADHFLKRDIRT